MSAHGTEPERRTPRRPAWVSWIGFGVGAGLLVWALIVVGGRWVSLREQWNSVGELGGGRWLLAALCVGLPVLNWLLTAAAFRVVTLRYGRVERVEMAALIGAASLLNYLPMRPGLIGRVAYHRSINGIAVWASAKVLLAVVGCSGAAAALLLAAMAVAGPDASTAWSAAAAGVPAIMLGGLWAVAAAKGLGWAGYAGGAAIRYLDVLVWTARYAAAFALWGAPIGLGGAAVVAAVSQVVTLFPLAGNGLGLREWGTAYTAAWLAGAGLIVTAAGPREVGLAADLTIRAAELVMLVPIGVWGWVWVARRLARKSGNEPPTTAEHMDG